VTCFDSASDGWHGGYITIGQSQFCEEFTTGENGGSWMTEEFTVGS
jgi:hypothetical protein